MAAEGRIAKEIKEIRKDTNAGITVDQNPSNSKHLTGTIHGPADTPYAGGVFTVDIVIPNDYPFSPPKMKFLTKLWHPNVSSQTGAICLDILKDQWSPALTIKTAMLSLQALMCSPEPNDPQDAEVANMYKTNMELFTATAAFWTESFAKPPGAPGSSNGSSGAARAVPVPAAVQRLMDMGFEQGASMRALAKHKMDENAAVEELLSSM